MNNNDIIRQTPVSFTCDYNEGAHPEILRRLVETNMEQEPGYGSDQLGYPYGAYTTIGGIIIKQIKYYELDYDFAAPHCVGSTVGRFAVW